MNIGFLDLGLAPFGAPPSRTLAHTVEAAVRADALGLERYWLAEHYAADCAWAYAAPLAMALLARTRRIRVGTGGVLLNVHDPFRVACDARLIAAMHPGRFELGIGRGGADPPWDEVVAPGVDDYATKVESLLAHLHPGTDCTSLDGGGARAIPSDGEPPPVWVLGSGTGSTPIARRHRLAFGLSLFHGETLPPRPEVPGPFLLAVAGSCGATRAQAERRLAAETLHFVPRVVGDATQCREALAALATRYGAESVMFVELVRDHGYRLDSLTALAEAAPTRPAGPPRGAGGAATGRSKC
ncbi:MAG: LLM class flavin-dependent oxidoreductase [Ectothiorhodospiraceae bacterium]|nr:LLM class flavin-dependent oxidoreductase [Chromatiales bacterium]MCP5154834.1 LLM class flavin-dependent oxidoreductase [Ectothiorhodospiraceae bacterium]